jgi:hypothetical protein
MGSELRGELSMAGVVNLSKEFSEKGGGIYIHRGRFQETRLRRRKGGKEKGGGRGEGEIRSGVRTWMRLCPLHFGFDKAGFHAWSV